MTRAPLRYNEHAPTQAATGFDPDVPIAGLYRHKLRSGAVSVAIRIWHGLPLDPVTGEELDRAPRWNATANGEAIDLERVWPACADEPIDAATAEHLVNLQRWGRENGHAELADPRRRLNPLTTPLQF